MEIKIYRNIHLKVISILICLLLAVMPFFQPKKVNANPAIVFAGILAVIATGMIAGGYARDTILTPEQINNANDHFTANLQTAFPDPAEYNKQLTTLQNLDNDIRAGKDIDWSKYSGKALYAVLKGVVDVVWPYQGTGNVFKSLKYIGTAFGYEYYMPNDINFSYTGWNFHSPSTQSGDYDCHVNNDLGYLRTYIGYKNLETGIINSNTILLYVWPDFIRINHYGPPLPDLYCGIYSIFNVPGVIYPSAPNPQYVPSITAKTANKIKLPTRLPQTVINNITNYIDGSSENLIVNPTTDELPQLPDNYNPTTDELPDLPGYVDVTPDQEPSTDPEPTPTPPDPTPTPPKYDGSGWVNPIGNFLAGLLEFLKTAFVPTQSLDFSPLQNMESSTFGAKFPFSLPSDFGKILGVLQAEPITPKFDASIPLSKVGYQDIPMEIDLEPYSNIAGICKSGFVILFCIGLFFLTRRFMSPGG